MILAWPVKIHVFPASGRSVVWKDVLTGTKDSNGCDAGACPDRVKPLDLAFLDTCHSGKDPADQPVAKGREQWSGEHRMWKSSRTTEDVRTWDDLQLLMQVRGSTRNSRLSNQLSRPSGQRRYCPNMETRKNCSSSDQPNTYGYPAP